MYLLRPAPLSNASQGVYDFRPCDKIVDWASDKGMAVKGHTLCWHVTTPEFAEEMSASKLREALYRQGGGQSCRLLTAHMPLEGRSSNNSPR